MNKINARVGVNPTLGENDKTAKTDAWYELRIGELEKQLKSANDALEESTKKLGDVQNGDVQRLRKAIVDSRVFSEAEVADKDREALLIIQATIDRLPKNGKGIRPGASDSKQDSKLTAGRWDAAKKEWVQ